MPKWLVVKQDVWSHTAGCFRYFTEDFGQTNSCVRIDHSPKVLMTTWLVCSKKLTHIYLEFGANNFYWIWDVLCTNRDEYLCDIVSDRVQFNKNKHFSWSHDDLALFIWHTIQGSGFITEGTFILIIHVELITVFLLRIFKWL